MTIPFSAILDLHEVLKGCASTEDEAAMTDDGASKEDNSRAENNGEATEYSPAMTEDDDSDAAHKSREESAPVQKKRKLDRSKRHLEGMAR